MAFIASMAVMAAKKERSMIEKPMKSNEISTLSLCIPIPLMLSKHQKPTVAFSDATFFWKIAFG